MNNNKLTDDRIAALLDCVDMCDDMSIDENADMAKALRELQERRKAGERLQESAYKSGLTAGWNFGIEHNSAGFSKCLAAHEYAAPQPVPVVPDEWTIQDAVKFCRETGRQDAGSAMEAWNACRTAMLRGNHRDLSQPIGQQVAEYEKIMLQGSQPVSDRDELREQTGGDCES